MWKEYIIDIIILILLLKLIKVMISKLKTFIKERRELRRLESSRNVASTGVSGNATVPPLPVRPTRTNNQLVSQRQRTIPMPSQSQNIVRQAAPSMQNGKLVFKIKKEDFPKCPIHKCCNRKGQSQKIFWDQQKKMWNCYHGHSFLS